MSFFSSILSPIRSFFGLPVESDEDLTKEHDEKPAGLVVGVKRTRTEQRREEVQVYEGQADRQASSGPTSVSVATPVRQVDASSLVPRGSRAPWTTPMQPRQPGTTPFASATPRTDEILRHLSVTRRPSVGFSLSPTTVSRLRSSPAPSFRERARVTPSRARRGFTLYDRLAPVRAKVRAARTKYRESIRGTLPRLSIVDAARARGRAALEEERAFAANVARVAEQSQDVSQALAELRELEAKVFALKMREEAVAIRLGADRRVREAEQVSSSEDESSLSEAPEGGSGPIVLLSSDDESEVIDDQHDPWVDRLAGLLAADVTPFVDVMTQPLCETLEQAVDGAFEANNETRLCGVTGFPVHGRDIQTLLPHAWLNDEIINGFYGAVQHMAESHPESFLRVRTFSSFFYSKVSRNGFDYSSVRRWVKNGDLFDVDRLIFPIHLGNHWTCAVIDLRHRTVLYYDSLGGKNGRCRSTLLRWLDEAHAEHRPNEPPLEAAKTWRSVAPSVPLQDNMNDCGVFSCQFALASAAKDQDAGEDGATFPFRARDMPDLRRRMVALLLKLNAE